ncbi:ankyrin repeat-containing domain protein [Nemania sp. FL0031]|nr:ankyrin repeat-containing domain protein [Nemania sp. FL0031]
MNIFKAIEAGNESAVRLLLPGWNGVNTLNNEGCTPLIMAVEGGREAIVEWLLGKDGVDINAQDNKGWSPLMYAVSDENEPIVEMLLARPNIDINIRSKGGETPLMAAAAYGSDEIVKLLLANADIDTNARKNDGRTSLMAAVTRAGNEEVVKLLLAQEGADLNARDNNGYTLLMLAAGISRNEATVGLLLARGADVHATNNSGFTSLMLAAMRPSNEATVGLLLAQGADLNARDINGWTSLMLAAARAENETTVKLLLTWGADMNVSDNNGRTLLMLAAEIPYNEAAVELLLSRGADPNTRDYDDGWTSLAFAAAQGQTEATVKLLLTWGSDVNATDSGGCTPLMLAVMISSNEETVKLLLAQGADLNARDNDGCTSLVLAAGISDNVATLELLLAKDNTHLNARDANGRTPLILAAEGGDEAMVELLLSEKDVDLNAKDHRGRTPLMAAVVRGGGNEKVVALLLAQDGVDPNARDNNGYTPLWVAMNAYENRATIDLLLDCDSIDLFATDNCGLTALSFMVQKDEHKVVMKLFNPRAVGMRRRTLLSQAAETGDEVAVRWLLRRHTTDPNARDSDGRTPLWWAAEKGHYRVAKQLVHRDTFTLHMLIWERSQSSIQLLLDAGYNVNTRDSNGMTPIQLAVQVKDGDLVQKLLKYKAHPKNIMASDWRNVFGKEEKDIVQLSKGSDGARQLCFITADDLLQTPTQTERCLYIFADDSLWPRIATTDSKVQLEPSKLHISLSQEIHDRGVAVFISLWFPVELHLSQRGLHSPHGGKCRIAWKIIQPANPSKDPWKPIVYFNMLPHGWIPDDDIDFFNQFVVHLKVTWLNLCERVEKGLNKSRLDQLQLEGKSPELMHRLAKEAQKCAELHDILEQQVYEAKEFVTDYCRRYRAHQTPDLKVLTDFEYTIDNQIGKLDQTIRDLLQIEFAWASITEARISTKLGQNVMLLTYVSIFYLPLGFCAALWAIPDITDSATKVPFVITSAIVGLVTLLVAFNLENIAGSMGRVYRYWRDKVLQDMRSDDRWKEKGRKFQDMDLSRTTPSEWWLLGYLGYRLTTALRRKKKESQPLPQ